MQPCVWGIICRIIPSRPCMCMCWLYAVNDLNTKTVQVIVDALPHESMQCLDIQRAFLPCRACCSRASCPLLYGVEFRMSRTPACCLWWRVLTPVCSLSRRRYGHGCGLRGVFIVCALLWVRHPSDTNITGPLVFRCTWPCLIRLGVGGACGVDTMCRGRDFLALVCMCSATHG